jgi:hypothetical protein
MGLLAPKNQVIGTTGTGSVLPTRYYRPCVGTTDKDSLAAENQVIGTTCTVSVVPPPLKISPRNSPKLSIDGSLKPLGVLRRKFWGDDEHPKERLCPKNYGLKLPTTPEIVKPMPLPQEHEEHKNHQNRSRFRGFVRARSPSKEAQGPHT